MTSYESSPRSSSQDGFPLPRAVPRRQHSASSTRSTASIHKRSPSPRVSFTPTQISSDKGVKNITRKVIRKLEGLGHLELYELDDEETQEQGEVEQTLVPKGPAAQTPSEYKTPSTPSKQPVDYEIPRKVLHSSIGFFTIFLFISQNTPHTVVLVLWTALAVIVPADILRLRYPTFAHVYERFLGFLMRESEKHSTNGVIWYILGVNFALTFYPLDIATVAILILSWADTAASTVGRLWGRHTPRLPAQLPFLRLPLAPRKSLAGFIAASITGATIAIGFWGWMAPLRANRADVTWEWDSGVTSVAMSSPLTAITQPTGWLGLGIIGGVAGLVSAVAEALDLGSLDDNLTLPIISGGCILGFFKILSLLGR